MANGVGVLRGQGGNAQQKLTQVTPHPPKSHTNTHKGLRVSLQSRCWKYQLHILIFLKTSLLQYLKQQGF